MLNYYDALHVGGSLIVMETLARAFDPRSVEAHLVFAYGGRGPVGTRSGVPCHYIGASGPADPGGILGARRILSDIAPDILHFHSPLFWLHAAVAGRRYRKLMHFHGPFPKEETARRRVWSVLPRLIHSAVCITGAIRDEVVAKGWSRPEKTTVVYNSIDCAHFENRPSREEARRRLGIPPDRHIAGVVCRLAWYKGCDDAIRLLSRLGPKWGVMFCGEGPMRGDLLARARTLGVADRVYFTGSLEDIRLGYAAMDAFLFLSRIEPFGLVLAEAMASRVPIFGLAAEGGYREVQYPLVTESNSVFFDREHPHDWAAPESDSVLERLSGALGDLARNPGGYSEMVEHAYGWVNSRFDRGCQSTAMLGVYEQMLQEAPGHLATVAGALR